MIPAQVLVSYMRILPVTDDSITGEATQDAPTDASHGVRPNLPWRTYWCVCLWCYAVKNLQAFVSDLKPVALSFSACSAQPNVQDCHRNGRELAKSTIPDAPNEDS